MPYVERDESENIIGLYPRPQSFASEFLEDNNQEVLDYLSPPKTWDDVRDLQIEMLSTETKTAWRVARYKSQEELEGENTTDTPGTMQLMLRYWQDIRDADETNHGTPQDAIDALTALGEPT